MHRANFANILLAVYGLLGVSEAYFRMSCGVIQSGRIDPVISPGKIAGHAHKIAGASSKSQVFLSPFSILAPLQSPFLESLRVYHWLHARFPKLILL